MWRGISLANKCLLLFGAAVVLIIVAALAVASYRMYSVVDEGHRDTARQVVLAWERLVSEKALAGRETPVGEEESLAGATVVLLDEALAAERAAMDGFVSRAWARFRSDPGAVEYSAADWRRAQRVDRYAKAVRDADGALKGMVLLTRPAPAAVGQLLVNTVYLFSAGLIALGLAVLVFYLITNRLILGPVRALRETAESVRQGNLTTRSSIDTGDEFEELSETFNQMLESLQESANRQREITAALDVRVGELDERNRALHEANRLKGEFVANVSHELRTPLNSIMGFAELLMEAAEREAAAGDDSTRLAKRRRYLENIVTAGRSLQELIDSLLEMARLEAGKTELNLDLVDIRETCEGLAALMRPQADKHGVELVLDLAEDLPPVETDAAKLRQIVFNFMSNAVKFTGEPALADAGAAGVGGDGRAAAPSPDGAAPNGAAGATGGGPGRPARVTLRAERLVGRASEGLAAEDRVRISVLDTGPGIAADDLPTIFEKFRQLESGLTRRHAGTGLGLAISKELAHLLQGEIQVESEVGRGSMFSLILPLRIDPARAAEMRLEMGFRGALAAQRRAAAQGAG
jgi:signal transduction histidine kinase